jgi:hypothetical protein
MTITSILLKPSVFNFVKLFIFVTDAPDNKLGSFISGHLFWSALILREIPACYWHVNIRQGINTLAYWSELSTIKRKGFVALKQDAML